MARSAHVTVPPGGGGGKASFESLGARRRLGPEVASECRLQKIGGDSRSFIKPRLLRDRHPSGTPPRDPPKGEQALSAGDVTFPPWQAEDSVKGIWLERRRSGRFGNRARSNEEEEGGG